MDAEQRNEKMREKPGYTTLQIKMVRDYQGSIERLLEGLERGELDRQDERTMDLMTRLDMALEGWWQDTGTVRTPGQELAALAERLGTIHKDVKQMARRLK
jgi:hypothetical protein